MIFLGREFGCVPGNGASLVFAACGGFEFGDGDGQQFLYLSFNNLNPIASNL